MGTGDAPFVAETNSLGTAIVAVKLDANKQLQFVDYFAPPNANWLFRRDLDLNVSPMAFDYRGRKFLVATSKECQLVAARSRRPWRRRTIARRCRRRPCSATTCRRSTARASGARSAAWQDAKGRQWVVVPFYGPVSRTFKAPVEHARPVNGGVAAYTLEERDGKWQLVPQWLSRDMDMAEHAIVANGVIFTYGSGEDASQIVPDRAFDDPAGAADWRRRQQCRRRPRIPRSAARHALRARRADGT